MEVKRSWERAFVESHLEKCDRWRNAGRHAAHVQWRHGGDGGEEWRDEHGDTEVETEIHKDGCFCWCPIMHLVQKSQEKNQSVWRMDGCVVWFCVCNRQATLLWLHLLSFMVPKSTHDSDMISSLYRLSFSPDYNCFYCSSLNPVHRITHGTVWWKEEITSY